MSGKKHYQGHRRRLRERLLRSPRQLAEYEILELLLGHVLLRQDTKPLAKELLHRFGTLNGVFSARTEDLRKVHGFGPALESFWALWRETWARMSEAPLTRREVLESPQAVAQMAIARLGGKTAEEFWVAMVDTKNRLVAWEQVSRGTVDQAPVYVREVLAMALRFEASGLILVHNHPGGGLEPSRKDRELTRRISAAAQALGVRVLDHMIVGDDTHYSFRTEGLLPEQGLSHTFE
ncbi:RadC family protein [Desulfovibrio ferrophilus]|uniref:DNA repair protein RadC n=1 Tax=Desulfovibrio ferrophilus TaxID=241368 RepID=A0A2Z6B0H9_9BACT|nr:DNA repair protein RadC [Desulfovibrio ferrophilus]BBD08958.1 DNA repair protein RadC [Desulfovibrio ferrophilus]